jgi:hypothetical protein
VISYRPEILCMGMLILVASSAWGQEASNVAAFVVRMHPPVQQRTQTPPAQSLAAAQPDMAGTLSKTAGLSLRRTHIDDHGNHHFVADRAMTRREAWDMATRMVKAHPELETVQPVDPDYFRSQPARPSGSK